MIHLDFTLADPDPARAPLIPVVCAFTERARLMPPELVLAAQAQNLFQWMRQVATRDALTGAVTVPMGALHSEIFAINRTLEKIGRTPIFPTEFDFELYKAGRS